MLLNQQEMEIAHGTVIVSQINFQGRFVLTPI